MLHKEHKRILRINVQNHPPLGPDDELSTNILFFLGNKSFELVIFPVESETAKQTKINLRHKSLFLDKALPYLGIALKS